MDDRNIKNVQTSYDRVADEYVQRIFDELQHKPLDRELLERLAREVRPKGIICDLGCGPGHVARYLHEHGATVTGLDLSPAMVERARQLNPAIEFIQGNMLNLPLADGSLAGIAAFYSIIHIPRSDVAQALAEFKRVLEPGAVLLLAFHIGNDTVHLDEWWDKQVNVDFHFFQPQAMAGYLAAADLRVEEIIERDPYPDVEHQSRRAYIFAKKGDA